MQQSRVLGLGHITELGELEGVRGEDFLRVFEPQDIDANAGDLEVLADDEERHGRLSSARGVHEKHPNWLIGGILAWVGRGQASRGHVMAPKDLMAVREEVTALTWRVGDKVGRLAVEDGANELPEAVVLKQGLSQHL